MALQLANYSLNGLALPGAYLRITNVTLDFRANIARIAVAVYSSAAAREAGANPFMIYNWPVPLSALTGNAQGINGSSPTALLDAARANAYAALYTLTYPEVMAVLAGSTPV